FAFPVQINYYIHDACGVSHSRTVGIRRLEASIRSRRAQAFNFDVFTRSFFNYRSIELNGEFALVSLINSRLKQYACVFLRYLFFSQVVEQLLLCSRSGGSLKARSLPRDQSSGSGANEKNRCVRFEIFGLHRRRSAQCLGVANYVKITSDCCSEITRFGHGKVQRTLITRASSSASSQISIDDSNLR